MSQSNINQSSRSVTRGSLVGILTAVFALVIGLVGLPTTASAAPDPKLQTDMNVLVLGNGAAGTGETAPYETLMIRDGIKYTRITNTATITPTYLADTPPNASPRAKFQAVIIPTLPSESPAPTWWTNLKTYASTFGIRILTAVATPNSTVAMNAPSGGQQLDGIAGQVTPAGLAGPFNYLNGPVQFPDIDPAVLNEYWGYLATPLASPSAGTSMTPMVTVNGTDNVLVGLYSAPGLEHMIVTFAGNAGQVPFQVLGTGILNWLTQGTHFGLTRNFLSVHVDDILNADARWDVNNNCTPGEDAYVGKSNPPVTCTVSTGKGDIIMSTADVDALLGWQTAAGIYLDMAFNAQPSVDRLDAGTDAGLTSKFLVNKASLRWVNHTYNHLYFGCTQVTTAPYNCVDQTWPVTDWVSASDILGDINSNLQWAASNQVPLDPTELISGEHSGLWDNNLGRLQGDNPNFVSVLNQLGIKVTGSDASKAGADAATGKAADPRTVGTGTRTLPRYPNSLYYNVATKQESADEYNWIYGPSTNPQGNCVAVLDVTTCLADILDVNTAFDSYIAPFEARQALGHVLNNDPRPHFVHQSNIAEAVGPDSLVYTWLNLVLNGGGPANNKAVTGYKAMYNPNTPIVNPTMTEASLVLTQQASWLSGKGNVSGYIKNGQAVITNSGGAAVWVPLSAGAGKLAGTATDFGEAYLGTRSTWTQLGAGQTLKVDIATNVAPVASFTETCTAGSCTFTSTTTDVDSEVGSFTYDWDFGDANSPAHSTTGPVTNHTFAANGTYNVTLKVTDLRGGVGTVTKSVVITGTPNTALPVAVAEFLPCTDLTCTFDGSKSSDSDGITAYDWDFGDGATGTGAKPSHTFPFGGDFPVKLTVTDGKSGKGSATVTVKVVAPRVNEAPTASFTTTCLDLTCGANASASTDDGTIVSYQWTFGDGTSAAGVNPLGHVFPAAGTYTVTLTVYDNDGASASTAKAVTVSAPAPAPIAAAPASIVKVSAVSKKGKLKVDVDPNQTGKGYWKFKVQYQKKNGSWGQYKKTYKTVGKKETKTINFKKGNYRVIVLPKYGLASSTSVVVTLKK